MFLLELEVPVIDDAYWAKFPEVLSLDDLVTITKKAKPTVWRWLHNGVIPAHQIGVSKAGTYIVYRDVFRRRLEDGPEAVGLPDELLAKYDDDLEREDLMALLGKSNLTIYKWLVAGLIPNHRLGATWYVRKSEFVEMLKRTSNQTSGSSGS